MSVLRWEVEGHDWPHRAASRFVTAGPMTWHVQMMGNGPPLLLLHGTGASSHSWRNVVPGLAERFRVVTPDLPGHGFTRGRPAGGMTLPGIAAAMAALLAALEIAPAVVAGHSAGAAIAARLALDGVTVAAPIVAFAPALLPFPGMLAPIFSAMAGLLLANPLAPRLLAQTARSTGHIERFLIRSTGSAIDRRGIELYQRLFRSPDHCRGAIAMMANWDLATLARALPRLAVPLHVAHGDRDSAIPAATARDASGRVPHGSFELLPGLGHLAHEERPELATDIVNRIADRQGGAR